MQVVEARDLVVGLISRGLAADAAPSFFDPTSPDGDPGKFVLDGRVARAIHHFDGWYVPINLDWFAGGFDQPEIKGTSFHWYVFALPARLPWTRDHYFICDYLQMRDWALGFSAPLGRDHQDHKQWRADLRVYADDPDEAVGYFRWGDEPIDTELIHERVFQLDNAATIADPVVKERGLRIGVHGVGGESSAHRRLKLFVADNPKAIGLAATAEPRIEYRFDTGDRVDVMFDNHRPHRTVVEVEVAGEQNLFIGVQQAVKYRSLAEVDGDFEPQSPRVHPVVVAYQVDYPLVGPLAERYGVELIGLDPSRALASVP